MPRRRAINQERIRAVAQRVLESEASGTRPLSNKKLAHDLMDLFGGTEGIARELHALYHHGATSLGQKQRILGNVMTLINRCDGINEATPLDMMTTEEIERELEQRCARIAKSA